MTDNAIPRPDIVKEKHLKYLDKLRESSKTNMVGAARYLENEFGLSKSDAKLVHRYWICSFDERNGAAK